MVGERATARQDGGGAGCVREVVGGMVRAGRVPASLCPHMARLACCGGACPTIHLYAFALGVDGGHFRLVG